MSEEEPIIRDAPEEERSPPKSEYEPDPERLCEFSEIIPESETKSTIFNCPKLADYRVLKHSTIKYLIDGGDASNPRHWQADIIEQYFCTKHFDRKYRYNPKPLPIYTFRRINRIKN
jgi:hypothetical protein